MAIEYKRLAALRPASTAEAQLYIVPASTEVVCNLFICNQSSTDLTYRVAHTDTAGAAAVEDWIAYDVDILANSMHQITGISIHTDETIRVRSSLADSISFLLSGMVKT